MQSLPRLLLQSAQRHAERTALGDERSALSYAGLATRVLHYSRHMLALELASLGRVAVLLEKSVDACALVLAAMHAGGIAVPLNPKLKPAQLRHILADCSAQLLFTTQSRHRELREALQGLALRVICIDEADLPSLDPVDDPQPWRRIDLDPAALLYTSGSTGAPKGVIVSHRNLVAGCRSVNEYLGTTAEDVILALLPISFDAGLSQLSTGLAAGAQVLLHTPMLAQPVARLVAQQRVSMITAVPPMWSLLAQARWNDDTRSVRLFANTGGHMSAALLAQLRQIFPAARPFLMYGLTEAFRSTYLDPAEVDRRPGSIGKAIPDAEILVLREDGSECAADEPGELVHRGALVSLGYWNAPELTALRFRPLPAHLSHAGLPEHAVWSGDLVRRDAEGYLYFIGRRDELIKSSGYRISPTELETQIAACPQVRDVAAFGIRAGDLGDAIHVAFCARDASAEPDSLRSAVDAWCRRTLPSYMVPHHYLLLDELPRSPNGKLDRGALRELCRQSSEAVQP